MKRGYHSTQRKYFGTVPRTVFLGFVLGYAIGLFLSGLFHLDSYVLQIVGLAIGTGIGYWMDGKYYAEKDVPVEDPETDAAQIEKSKETETND